MAEHIHLQGSEDVARAGHRIASAADDMQRAAASLDATAERLVRALDETVTRFEQSIAEGATPTLRDYFAGKAMQGAFDSPIASSAEEKDYIAKHAYAMADAMMKARSA